MTTTQKLKLDFNLQGTAPRIRAVQGDLYTRLVEISLYSHKTPWAIPEDADVLIRYRKPDRTAGAYDTLPNGESAWRIQGNTVTVTIAPLFFPQWGQTELSLFIFFPQYLQYISSSFPPQYGRFSRQVYHEQL